MIKESGFMTYITIKQFITQTLTFILTLDEPNLNTRKTRHLKCNKLQGGRGGEGRLQHFSPCRLHVSIPKLTAGKFKWDFLRELLISVPSSAGQNTQTMEREKSVSFDSSQGSPRRIRKGEGAAWFYMI